MADSDKKIDFEASLKELESIVTKLEDENISLEDSVKSVSYTHLTLPTTVFV